jgi:hypothetical protein
LPHDHIVLRRRPLHDPGSRRRRLLLRRTDPAMDWRRMERCHTAARTLVLGRAPRGVVSHDDLVHRGRIHGAIRPLAGSVGDPLERVKLVGRIASAATRSNALRTRRCRLHVSKRLHRRGLDEARSRQLDTRRALRLTSPRIGHPVGQDMRGVTFAASGARLRC